MKFDMFFDSTADIITFLLGNIYFQIFLAIATILGGISALHYFILYRQELKNKNKLEYYKKKLKLAQDAFHNKDKMFFLTEYLKWKYDDKILLNKLGYTYPIAIFPAPKEQRKDLESVLYKPLSKISTEDFFIYDDSYRKLIQELGNPMINRETFTMNCLSLNSKLKMNCQLGTYFDALDSCDALEWEILQNVSSMKNLEISRANFNLFSKKLKLRRKLHENVLDPVINGKGRSAAIAISTLIAFNDGEKFNLLVKMRSQTGVAVHAGLFHVVPSFMFQPIVGDRDFEFSIVHNIFREYLEEIFDIPEEDNTQAADYFYQNANLEILKKLIEKNEVELFFTGVAVNLLNLRPEICTLLLIRSPEWYRLQSQEIDTKIKKLKIFSYNKEFVSYSKIENKKDFRLEIEYAKNEGELLNSYSFYPNKMVPPGAAAFWLGYDLIKEILK